MLHSAVSDLDLHCLPITLLVKMGKGVFCDNSRIISLIFPLKHMLWVLEALVMSTHNAVFMEIWARCSKHC